MSVWILIDEIATFNRAKGVKVDLGIPLEMWDNPPAEITQLKTQAISTITFNNVSDSLTFSFPVQCEKLLEDHEETIEDWYASQQDSLKLQNHLCRKHVLSGKDQKCLDEKAGKSDGRRGEL